MTLTPGEIDCIEQSWDIQDTKIQGLINTLQTIPYTLLVVLYVHCCVAVYNQKSYSTNKKRTLLVYSTYMVISSSLAFIQNTYALMRPDSVLDLSGNFVAAFPPVFLPLALWGADGFLIWRCAVIYSDLPRLQRILLLLFLGFLSLLILAGGILAVAGNFLFLTGGVLAVACSIIVNTILTGLIVGRVTIRLSFITKLLGKGYGSLFMRAIVLCVESCALILVFEVPVVILTYTAAGGPVNTVMYTCLPHIFSISALLLVYRVANGSDYGSTIETMTMEFNHRESIQLSISQNNHVNYQETRT